MKIGKDKYWHAGLSFLLMLVFGYLLGNWWGFGIAFTLGLFKEIWDTMFKKKSVLINFGDVWRTRKFNWQDMIANMAGILFALLLLSSNIFGQDVKITVNDKVKWKFINQEELLETPITVGMFLEFANDSLIHCGYEWKVIMVDGRPKSVKNFECYYVKTKINGKDFITWLIRRYTLPLMTSPDIDIGFDEQNKKEKQ